MPSDYVGCVDNRLIHPKLTICLPYNLALLREVVPVLPLALKGELEGVLRMAILVSLAMRFRTSLS
jgi:hypothetical protein